MGWWGTIFFVSIAIGQSLNPSLNFTPSNPALEGKLGVLRNYQSPHGEANIKSTSLESSHAANRIAAVAYNLIRGLYEPKKNPYAGEVTSLVKCDQKFEPREFKFQNGESEVTAIIGGVGLRNSFGACTAKDIQKLGAYLSYYDPTAQLLHEIRLFVPYAEKKPWMTQIKSLEDFVRRLLL